MTEIDLNLTHTFAGVHTVSDVLTLHSLNVQYDDIIVNCRLLDLLSVYCMWRAHDLKQLAAVHNIRLLVRDTTPIIIEKLADHSCTRNCSHYLIKFTTLRAPRSREQLSRPRATPRVLVPPSPTSYLPVVDNALIRLRYIFIPRQS